MANPVSNAIQVILFNKHIRLPEGDQIPRELMRRIMLMAGLLEPCSKDELDDYIPEVEHRCVEYVFTYDAVKYFDTLLRTSHSEHVLFFRTCIEYNSCELLKLLYSIIDGRTRRSFSRIAIREKRILRRSSSNDEERCIHFTRLIGDIISHPSYIPVGLPLDICHTMVYEEKVADVIARTFYRSFDISDHQKALEAFSAVVTTNNREIIRYAIEWEREHGGGRKIDTRMLKDHHLLTPSIYVYLDKQGLIYASPETILKVGVEIDPFSSLAIYLITSGKAKPPIGSYLYRITDEIYWDALFPDRVIGRREEYFDLLLSIGVTITPEDEDDEWSIRDIIDEYSEWFTKAIQDPISSRILFTDKEFREHVCEDVLYICPVCYFQQCDCNREE